VSEPGIQQNVAPEEAREGVLPTCLECQSQIVRPSRSAYPRDAAKRAGSHGSFWRCDNCGARFLGPEAPEKKRRGHGRHGSRDPSGLTQSVKLGRTIKRIMFPAIVIIATVIAVIYILDRRSDRAEQVITFPE